MTRYATVITDADGREIVSAIGEFAGTAPHPHLGRGEQVASGVEIGMVQDGAGPIASCAATISSSSKSVTWF
ncbi:hypothetical protein EN962_07235 [Mesorhizobium sp. M7A.F.Ca.CA.001.09.2.1]|uniref:Uncharacterized protein n=2 Tax=Mesorhizobium ciceri TaxID=39645 RepID=E8TP27_MESCW|nr:MULTISPECIES: hypothetical protein [Mesorhizobium]RUY46523.1 hypothetical protein EN981_18920 [Mesorhizobium sp. M7A.F.Ca.CA.001.13.2.1]RVA29375.1 hypothetical protein EN933_34630 [Mesorhizobium sp. M7A.F.Ca.US.001.01.1.1]ADV15062.1 hypothetical protein Mesci_6056 [Mesorhizobium ciceri biovar biserrulae WSM1271]AMX97988.1 hypothetical protein A4R28_32975 [Mesorhizobium ciceri]AMY04319.1 hypothetical protein A4R29_32255 [Mesorhizobium ciceri biovar biserrulae]